MAAMSIGVAAGGVALAKQDTVVTQAAENWQVGVIEENYLYGTSFDVPAATVEVGETSVEAMATVTYPDGSTSTESRIALNQAGIYKVTYRAQVGGLHCVNEETFTVENVGYLMQNPLSSATYGKYTKYGANSEGLLVRLAPQDTLTFSQLIDVSALTGTEDLMNLFVTPDSLGVYDFSNLTIRLTDAIDPSIYVQYQLRRYNAEDRGYGTSYVDVTFADQPWVGCERDAYRFNGWGTPFTHTFYAAIHKGFAWTGEVVEYAPDKSTCRIRYNPLTTETSVSGSHIANLNNRQLFEEEWTGWPSGKARLTLTAKEVKAETANFCIKSIFGIDLTKTTFTEADAPIITPSMAEDDMPLGQVGFKYTIPSATAYDMYSGVCDTKVSVYRDYASASPISVGVKNNQFTPTQSGWYTIVYSAKDASGNEGKILCNVYVKDDLGDISVTLPANTPSEASLGDWVTVEPATYTGDCGIADMKITAVHNGETYEITDGFRPEIEGEWKVVYTVTDYIGRVGTAEYTINAVKGDGYVLLDEIILPQILLSDCEYELPYLEATSYVTGSAVHTPCKVAVTDNNGTKTYDAGDKFVPSVANSGDMVTITYQCGGVDVETVEVPTIIAKGDGEKIVAKNYFYGEGFSTSYTYLNSKGEEKWYSAGIEIIADETSERCGWTFATPQLTNNFKMEFAGLADKTRFESLVITLTDSKNKNEAISLELTVRPVGTMLVVGDKSVESKTISLITDDAYQVEYRNGKFTFGGVSIAAEKTLSGEEFTGFSSSLVYVSVDMKNPKAGASYLFRVMNESNISRRNLEVFAPNFEILGEFGGNQSINNVFEIFPAVANDVFAPNVDMTMTVSAPDGSIVVDNKGLKLENVATDKSYFITLTQYGKYSITYNVAEKDWVKVNKLEMVKAVFVIDEAAPQVAFTNATQTTAKVGDTISCPDVVYKDNVTKNEDMHIVSGVYNPYGKFFLFEEGQNAIKCINEGEYMFIVMVFDEFGNMNSVRHKITVTK